MISVAPWSIDQLSDNLIFRERGSDNKTACDQTISKLLLLLCDKILTCCFGMSTVLFHLDSHFT